MLLKKQIVHIFSSRVFRFSLSCALIFLIYSKLDLYRLSSSISSFSISDIALLVILYLIGQLLSAYKWNFFLLAAGIKQPLSRVIRTYFLGMFLNSFGLGTIGGDASRALTITAGQNLKPKSKTLAITTVVADRLHGLTILIIIPSLSLMILQPKGISGKWIWLVGGSAMSFISAMIAGPLLAKLYFPKLFQFYSKTLLAFSAVLPKKNKLIIASLISVLFHSLQIAMYFLMAKQLAPGLTISFLLVSIPIVNIASSLPISISGLGVREATILSLFHPFGVPLESCAVFAALWFISTTIGNSLGAFCLTSSLGFKMIVDKKQDEAHYAAERKYG